jgi:hypothetical protein
MIKYFKYYSFLILLIISYFLGYFLGDNIYKEIISPFKNTAGTFDYSIFWTAILGISTLVLSIVVAVITLNNQKENERNSKNHQTQIENLTRLNLELTDKLVHIETFKYFPQLKINLAKETNIQFEEHIQLYCETRDLYSNNISQDIRDSKIYLIFCKLENVGESYIDEIIFVDLVIITSSANSIRKIKYRNKPINTGCSSIFIHNEKMLILSFLKSMIHENDEFIQIVSHVIIKNGKTQLWETNWMNHIYIKIQEDNKLKPLHCTSTRLNTGISFNQHLEKILRGK